LKKKIDRAEQYLIVSLIIGIIFRIIFVITIPLNVDSYPFIRAARGILELDYNKYDTFRPPGFPLLIVPYLLLTGNGDVAAKLASLTSSIFLMVFCYFVFRNASKNLFDEVEKDIEKAKYVGFLVSLLISINIYFMVHPGYGIREEYLTLLCILVFYFTIIKKEISLKNNIILAFSVSLLTLSLLTTGLFFTAGIILFFFVSKLKWFKFQSIKGKKVLIILISFSISFLSWAAFSSFTWGDPLYNWQAQSNFFKDFYKMELNSLENIIAALLNALTGGIPYEFYYLFFFSSFVFLILVIYFIIKNFRIKQILFLFLVVGLNLLYLSVFIAPSKLINIPNSSRVMVYLLPFIYYLGAIPLGNIFVELERFKKNNSTLIYIFFFIFLVTYILKGLPFIIYLGYGGYPFPIHPLFIIIVILNEISLIILFLKTKDIQFPFNKNGDIKSTNKNFKKTR
jgi:hypothetical protein